MNTVTLIKLVRFFPVLLGVLPLWAIPAHGQTRAVDWGMASYATTGINSGTSASVVSTQDYNFDSDNSDHARSIPFGTLFTAVNSGNYVTPAGKTKNVYVGAQVVAYSSATDPSFGIFRVAGTPTANTQLQAAAGVVAGATMGFSSAFYSVKDEFLNGANSAMDLRLANTAASLSLTSGPQFKPAGGITQRFLVQADGQWYVSKEAVSAGNVTLAINGAEALWYPYDPSQNQFLNLANLGTAVAGATLHNISAYGVYTFSPSFPGDTANNGIQSVYGFSADLVPASEIGAPPTIDTQPQSAAIAPGGTVTFTVGASGPGALAYVWKKDGIAITGETGAILTLANVQAADAGSYTVVVSNLGGSVASDEAVLTVETEEAPIVSQQPVSQTVNAGETATFSVIATGTPEPTYQWEKDGVAVNGQTAATLTLPNVQAANEGNYTVVVTNSAGSVSSDPAALTVTAVAPTITAQPTSQTGAVGGSVTFSVTAHGTEPFTYAWQKDGTAISGATGATLSLTNLQSVDVGDYTVIVTNAEGSTTSNIAVLTVVTAVAPTIIDQPLASTVTGGHGLTLTVTYTGTPAPTFQWYKDGAAVAGATSDTYTLAAVTAGDAGTYTVELTNAAGSVISSAAIVTVLPANYLANLSVRASMDAQQTLILGFVVAGGSKPVLVRAAGPALDTNFHLSGALADPRLTLYKADGTAIAADDDWGNPLTEVFARLGAFPFEVGSKDAALLENVTSANTAHAPAAATGGIQLVELYDAGENNGVRLVNVSARNHVGTGDNILIAGFVISGEGKKQVLIRGIGPGLTTKFGLSGVLADPQLTLFDVHGEPVTSNDDWDSSLADTFARLGAFELPAGSKDAALILELDPGVYTAQVRGASDGTGEALVEVYDAAP